MKLDRATALKKLGASSAPFVAKFPGQCGLTGIKIVAGDEVAYYENGSLNGGPCHLAAIDYHIWFPFKAGTLTPEQKATVMAQIQKARDAKGSKS